MFREMLCRFPLAWCTHLRAKRPRGKRELKASLIIEKKQIGMFLECVKDKADLQMICPIPLCAFSYVKYSRWRQTERGKRNSPPARICVCVRAKVFGAVCCCDWDEGRQKT